MNHQFKNRSEAGKELATALRSFDINTSLVIALPCGGVPVAAEICRELDLPLDLVMVRKITVPEHNELALGAVVDGREPIVVINTDIAIQMGVDESVIREQGKKLLVEIEHRRERYLRNREPISVSGKTVILVDDGVATGASIRAAIRSLRKRHAFPIILALPLAPQKEIEELRLEADQTICLKSPFPFYSVGTHYAEYAQVTDAEVMAVLSEL